MKIEPRTLKGFRDFLPKEARRRQFVIDTLRKVFESYGFEPLETPALEYEDILSGKYGEEGEKLMYKFEDNGERKVALRYDQTVPLARVVAQYQNDIPLPFKRYQISNVWRGENPQRGRFREFTQCDIDTVGTSNLLADAEIIEVAIESLKALGFEKFKILLNDRKVFEGIDKRAIPIIDKLAKIGEDEVRKLLRNERIDENVLDRIRNTLPTETVEKIIDYLEKLEVDRTKVEFSPTLARGLDYYTGLIFEIEIEGYTAGSVCGGGRYDNLVGMFSNREIPAVGCAFGFDRILEAMNELSLFPETLQTTQVLVSIFSPELVESSIKACGILEEAGISQELYIDETAKMDKQLKYATQKEIPYVVIIGPKEKDENTATLKNMKTGEQETMKLEELPGKIPLTP